MLWIAALVLLQHPFLTSTQTIHLEFLRAVPRLYNTTTIRDYYFCCNSEGRFLQWEYNNQPLSGFQINNVGEVSVDERSDYTYTATLLSSLPMENRQAKMDSVLVMSFDNDMDPGQFMIICSSNHNITNITTTPDPISFVNTTKGNGEVQLDYVMSAKIVSNRKITHIVMCGARNTHLFIQFIEVIGRTLGFSTFDDIGQARNYFQEDTNTIDVQAILIAHESTLSVTLILISSDLEVVNVSCYNTVSNFSLTLVDSEVSTSIPEEESTGTVRNVFTIPFLDDATDVTENSSSMNALNPWTLLTACLLTILYFVDAIAAILARFISRDYDGAEEPSGNKSLSNGAEEFSGNNSLSNVDEESSGNDCARETERSIQGSENLSQAELDIISEEEKAETVSQKGVSEEENFPEEEIISVSNNQDLCLELEHKPEHRSLPGGETHSHHTSFASSYEEMSFNGKTSATTTASKPSHTSIDINEAHDVDRMVNEIHNSMNGLVRKLSTISEKSYYKMVTAAKWNLLQSIKSMGNGDVSEEEKDSEKKKDSETEVYSEEENDFKTKKNSETGKYSETEKYSEEENVSEQENSKKLEFSPKSTRSQVSA